LRGSEQGRKGRMGDRGCGSGASSEPWMWSFKFNQVARDFQVHRAARCGQNTKHADSHVDPRQLDHAQAYDPSPRVAEWRCSLLPQGLSPVEINFHRRLTIQLPRFLISCSMGVQGRRRDRESACFKLSADQILHVQRCAACCILSSFLVPFGTVYSQYLCPLTSYSSAPVSMASRTLSVTAAHPSSAAGAAAAGSETEKHLHAIAPATMHQQLNPQMERVMHKIQKIHMELDRLEVRHSFKIH
jgi:hypothetical protein